MVVVVVHWSNRRGGPNRRGGDSMTHRHGEQAPDPQNIAVVVVVVSGPTDIVVPNRRGDHCPVLF